MSKKQMETRQYDFEIRADDGENKGVIVGQPIVYESKTDLGFFDEIIQRGALEKTNLKDVRFLVNHNTDMIPLARSRNNNENSTMQLIPNDDGLGIRVKLDVDNNTEARNLYSAIERGDISGMSFMFSVGEDDWADLDTDHPTRTIKSISDVLEVSAVTFPAYEETSIGVRDKRALDSARSTLDNVRATSDDGASELELEKMKIKYLTMGD